MNTVTTYCPTCYGEGSTSIHPVCPVCVGYGFIGAEQTAENTTGIASAHEANRNRREVEQLQRENPETMDIYHPDYDRYRVHTMD